MVRFFLQSLDLFSEIVSFKLFRRSCSRLASRQVLSFALDLNHSRLFTINGSDLLRLHYLCHSYRQRTVTLLHSNKENYLHLVETPEISSMTYVFLSLPIEETIHISSKVVYRSRTESLRRL